MILPRVFWRGLAALFAGLVIASAVRSAEPLVLRADNWFPYNGDPSAEQPGYVIEMMRAILAREDGGGALDYRVMPWKRAIAEAEKGAINGVIGALKSDTPGFVFPEEPIGLSGSTIFVRKDSTWRYSGPDSLKQIRLGVVDGYSYDESIDAYIAARRGDSRAIDVSLGDIPEEAAIKKLQAGRIDAYLSDPAVFRARVAAMKLNADDFMEAGVVSEPSPIYISLSPARPDSAAWANRISAGIRTLRASGELAGILKRYGLRDWAGAQP